MFPPPVWPSPRSLATTCGISFDFFSSPYLDVSVQAVPRVHLWIQHTLTEYSSAGLPHSDTHGSMPAFGSPWLFADRCVLLRFLVPRHSPCALCSLTLCDQSGRSAATGLVQISSLRTESRQPEPFTLSRLCFCLDEIAYPRKRSFRCYAFSLIFAD